MSGLRMFSLAIVVLFCVFAGGRAGTKLSELVTPCSVNDPNLNQCLSTLTKKLMPAIIKGSKDLGFPPLEPLFVPEMVLTNTGGESIGFSLTMEKANHFGRKDMKLKTIKCNPKTLEFEVNVLMDQYQVLGEYTTNGRILLLPIKGHGDANMTFVDVDILYNFKLTPIEKKGTKYFNVENLKTQFRVGRVHVKLDNLFGNKVLSDTMNTFLNENWEEVYTELKPKLEATMTDIDYQLFSNALTKIPADMVLKDVK